MFQFKHFIATTHTYVGIEIMRLDGYVFFGKSKQKNTIIAIPLTDV